MRNRIKILPVIFFFPSDFVRPINLLYLFIARVWSFCFLFHCIGTQQLWFFWSGSVKCSTVTLSKCFANVLQRGVNQSKNFLFLEQLVTVITNAVLIDILSVAHIHMSHSSRNPCVEACSCMDGFLAGMKHFCICSLPRKDVNHLISHSTS